MMHPFIRNQHCHLERDLHLPVIIIGQTVAVATAIPILLNIEANKGNQFIPPVTSSLIILARLSLVITTVMVITIITTIGTRVIINSLKVTTTVVVVIAPTTNLLSPEDMQGFPNITSTDLPSQWKLNSLRLNQLS